MLTNVQPSDGTFSSTTLVPANAALYSAEIKSVCQIVIVAVTNYLELEHSSSVAPSQMVVWSRHSDSLITCELSTASCNISTIYYLPILIEVMYMLYML